MYGDRKIPGWELQMHILWRVHFRSLTVGSGDWDATAARPGGGTVCLPVWATGNSTRERVCGCQVHGRERLLREDL